MDYIKPLDCIDFLKSLDDNSVNLILTDPPYFGIVKDSWDNAWSSVSSYNDWLKTVMTECLRVLTPTGSMVMFQGIGSHKNHPIFRTISDAEDVGFYYRNWITWKKRRAYGKSHDYLFCREEIVWFSKSENRTEVTFNIPLLDVKRGYDGFNSKYKAKSEFKRVSNVWDDIPELMKTQRVCQKPEPLIKRLIETHSNPGDLVIDIFSGYGVTGVVALKEDRKFLGCEAIEKDAIAANERCKEAISQHDKSKT